VKVFLSQNLYVFANTSWHKHPLQQ